MSWGNRPPTPRVDWPAAWVLTFYVLTCKQVSGVNDITGWNKVINRHPHDTFVTCGVNAPICMKFNGFYVFTPPPKGGLPCNHPLWGEIGQVVVVDCENTPFLFILQALAKEKEDEQQTYH